MNDMPLIAVAGSTQASSWAEARALELGEALVSAGYRLVTGGMGGVMAGVARGARRSPAWTGNEVMGLLPGWEEGEGNPWLDIPLATGLGRYRNTLLASSCDAMVALEGGAGTLSEIALAWQEGRPLMVLGESGISGRMAGTVLDHRRPEPLCSFETVDSLLAALDQLFPRGCFGMRGMSRWFHEQVPCLHRVHDENALPLAASAHGLQRRLGFSYGRRALMRNLTRLAADLDQAQQAGAPARRLLVTFDDAYSDLLLLKAWFKEQPFLQPAVFVTASILRGEPLWFDLLYQALENYCGAGHQPDEALKLLKRGLADPMRMVAAGEARGLVKSWAKNEGLPEPRVPDDLYLDLRALGELAGEGWIVAGHGDEHHDLCLLTDQALERDLDSCIEAVLGLGGVPWLAYPDGQWDERVRRCARRAGYTLLLTIDGMSKEAAPGQVNRELWPPEARR